MEAPQTPELQEIRHLRKRYNLTQSQLAKLAGVSQSLIAKIEAGTVDPTFSHAKRILESLHGLSREREPKAEQLITSKIIFNPNLCAKERAALLGDTEDEKPRHIPNAGYLGGFHSRDDIRVKHH